MNGLYVITSEHNIDTMVVDVAKAIAGGAKMVQYRHKNITYEQQLFEAQDLQILCKHLSIPLIINDNPKLAKEVRASGVHLGKMDTDIQSARNLLGTSAIIGVSCYDNLQLAINAEKQGADYVAFGSFFNSTTKPNANNASFELLTEAKKQLNITVIAIGGINQNNCIKVISAGADMVAVIDTIFASNNIQNTAQLISNQFHSNNFQKEK